MFKVVKFVFRELIKHHINFPTVRKWQSTNSIIIQVFHRQQKRTSNPLTFSYVGILTYLGLAKRQPEETMRDKTIKSVKMAILAQQEGNNELSEQLLHVALRMAQEQMDYNGVTYIYDVMANLAMETEDYEKAEKLFKDVVHRLITQGKPIDDNSIIDISIKLAEVYGNLDKLEEAEEGFNYCWDILNKSTVTQDHKLLLAKVSNAYGKHCMKLKLHKKALPHYELALKISIEENGENHPQTLILMNDVANCYLMNGDAAEAIKHLKQAIRIAKGNNYKELSCFYTNLGRVFIEMVNLNKAAFNCKKGVVHAKDNVQKNEAEKCLELLERKRKEAMHV